MCAPQEQHEGKKQPPAQGTRAQRKKGTSCSNNNKDVLLFPLQLARMDSSCQLPVSFVCRNPVGWTRTTGRGLPILSHRVVHRAGCERNTPTPTTRGRPQRRTPPLASTLPRNQDPSRTLFVANATPGVDPVVPCPTTTTHAGPIRSEERGSLSP